MPADTNVLHDRPLVVRPAASFPSPELVSAAAGLFDRLPAWDGHEGPRARIVVSPGSVAVRTRDAARLERAAERAVSARRALTDLAAIEIMLPVLLADASSLVEAVQLLVDAGVGSALDGVRAEDREAVLYRWLEATWVREDRAPSRVISVWSAKSRSRMVETLASLDYTPFDTGRAAMLTLTYPGDWLAVAPTAKVAANHLKLLQLRYKRAWGGRLAGIWKREFQDRKANCWDCRRGTHVHPDSGRAPHAHIYHSPPSCFVHLAQDCGCFREWLARTWVSIVNPQNCRVHRAEGGCCEWARMLAVHSHRTVVDFDEGSRCTDPKRLAVYFSKHGSFQAKDYQNQAPDEWLATGVGRFWGYWGLSSGRVVVEVSAEDRHSAARVLRRWSRANSYIARVPSWKSHRAPVDNSTGELLDESSGFRFYKSTRLRRVYRMQQSSGFVTANDGPALASALARALPHMRKRPPARASGRYGGFAAWSQAQRTMRLDSPLP